MCSKTKGKADSWMIQSELNLLIALIPNGMKISITIALKFSMITSLSYFAMLKTKKSLEVRSETFLKGMLTQRRSKYVNFV